MSNNKNYAIMEKVFQIVMFNKQTKNYDGTYRTVFKTAELAKKQIAKFNNPNLIFTVIKVDLIFDKDYIE